MILLSNWGSIQLTNASRTLVASGATIKFTKIKLGSGTLSNIDTATDLAKPKQIVPLTGLNVSNGVAALTGLITTDKVDNSFMASEAGVFASDNNGGEILFLVCNDTSPDLIPDKSNPVPTSISYTFNIAANSATADLDNSSLVVLSLLNRHKIDPNAHGSMTSTIDDTATPTTNTNDLRTLLSNLAARLRATAGTADWKLTVSDLETLNNAVKEISVDQTVKPTKNTGDLQSLLSGMSNRVKAITGYSDWKDDTVKSLKDVAKWFSDLKKLNSFMQICGMAGPDTNRIDINPPSSSVPTNINNWVVFNAGFGFLNFSPCMLWLQIDASRVQTSNTLAAGAPISADSLYGYEIMHPINSVINDDSIINTNTPIFYATADDQSYVNNAWQYKYYICSTHEISPNARVNFVQGWLNGFGGLLND